MLILCGVNIEMEFAQVGTPLSVLQYVIDCGNKVDGSLDGSIEKEIFAQFPDEVQSLAWARPEIRDSAIPELGPQPEETTGDIW